MARSLKTCRRSGCTLGLCAWACVISGVYQLYTRRSCAIADDTLIQRFMIHVALGRIFTYYCSGQGYWHNHRILFLHRKTFDNAVIDHRTRKLLLLNYWNKLIGIDVSIVRWVANFVNDYGQHVSIEKQNLSKELYCYNSSEFSFRAIVTFYFCWWFS